MFIPWLRAIAALAIVAGLSGFLILWNPSMLYLWLKALHVIAVIAWMAGMLYLPRLFVYRLVDRFSSVAGGAVSGDLPRGVRGMFCTEEGNFDRRQQHSGVLHPECHKIS